VRIDEPYLTEAYASPRDFLLPDGCGYIYSEGEEERSKASDVFADKSTSDLVLVNDLGENVVQFCAGEKSADVPLLSSRRISEELADIGKSSWYLDITGLAHHVWMPILKVLLEKYRDVRVVYVEPEEYAKNPDSLEGQIYDLSERIQGVSPIPGFASLYDRRRGHSVFIPILGFEGTRLSYIFEQVQPKGNNIVPIMGVPGFQPGFPFESYAGNRQVLLDTGSWSYVRYADAGCPFSLFFTVDDIVSKRNTSSVKIAPIGTKPNALGALLYKIANPSQTELIYDHPIRKEGRTKGVGKMFVYHVSEFASRRVDL